MPALTSLENKLDDIFVNNAPALPSNAKKIIVEYLPYINLVLGVLTLLAAWGLYNAARTVNTLVETFNNYSTTFGTKVTVNKISAIVWIAIAVLVLEGLLYIAAYPATKARQKSGWNLLFYALLINVVYGLVVAFTDYGGVGRLLSSLIGSAVGFYFLFQIRGSYRAARTGKSK